MTNAPFSVFWSLVVPGGIVVFSFLVTLWLYRVFAKTHHGDGK